MIWHTRITKMTGIKYPIIMGAFAKIGKASFAAAFSNAGGLGTITASIYNTIEEFQKELELMKKLTNKPFCVNFSIMPPMMLEKNPKARTEESYLDFVDVAMGAGVKVFTTSAYQAPKIGKKIRDGDCLWFHKCATIKHAISAEKSGADAVTIVGLEGAGFKNPVQNTTLVNITMAQKILKIPIIAAGGIGDARGFLGALFMGADAVCFGTSIAVTKESPAPEDYKNEIFNQDIFDEEYHKKIFQFDLKNVAVGSMALGHIDKQLSIKEFVDNIVENAEKIIKSWGFDKNVVNIS